MVQTRPRQSFQSPGGVCATLLLVFMALAPLISGCGDSKRDPAKDKVIASESTETNNVSVQANDKIPGDDTEPLTPEAYEQLLLGLASCAINGEHIDRQCEAKKAFDDARRRTRTLQDPSGLITELGKRHIGHASPAVRIVAAGFLTSVFGADESSQGLLIAAARKEKEPAVLVSMIQTVGSKGGSIPEIGALLMEMADHESAAVRKKAVVWLGSSWNAKLEGSIEKLNHIIETDPDPEVRRFACKYSGDRGDDRMIDTYDKYTADPSADPRLYAACMEGLMNSWLRYPLFNTHSERAYRLTLKRLAYTPRSKETPPWTLMSNFAELANETGGRVTKWREQATWFKSKDVLAVLGPIVTDRDAYRLARTGALKSMVALGVSKRQLETMRKAYGDSDNFDDKSVIEELDKALTSAP